MTATPDDFSAPRSRSRIGARRRWGLLAAVALGIAICAPGVAAQDPPPPPPPDTAAVGDSLMQVADSTLLESDSVSADTIFYNLPEIRSGVPDGFATGVWTWDRDAIMASGANTLAELFAEVPGMIPLWGGDYGTPIALSAFGSGGGGVRLFRDGFEVYPVDGGVADLQQIGLAGIVSVRLDRSMAGMRVDLQSHAFDDGRPFSVVEAGTGDLDTNLFRGTYADPTALGGSLALAMERVDTRGRAPDEGGNRTGTWVRYQLHAGDRGGIAFDFRRMGSQTKVPVYAPTISRTDVTARARYEFVPGVVAEAYTGRSSLDATEAGAAYETWAGERQQHGGRLQVRRGELWATGEARFFSGDDLPARQIDGEFGGTIAGRLGFAASVGMGSWAGNTETLLGVRGWAGGFGPLSLFGAYQTGSYGSRDAPLLDGLTITSPLPPQPVAVAPTALVTERTTARLGGTIDLFGSTFSGAYVAFDADAFLPIGQDTDFQSPVEPGSTHIGLEATGSIPFWLEGLRVQGSYQRWDQEAPFLPKQTYQASLEFHRVYLETGNFELWWSAGVRGRDPMSVFVPPDGLGSLGGLQEVRFYQNWYARVQARILTVRLFLGWENMSLRRSLESFPDRKLPVIRSFFGLRWDMWS